MGVTAERIHDRFPHLTKDARRPLRRRQPAQVQAAYEAGKIQPDLVRSP